MSKKSKARSKEEKDPALSAKRRRAMVQYLAIMCSVAVVLIVLSLFINLRNEKDVSGGLRDNASRQQQKIEAYEKLAEAQLDYQSGDMEAFAEDCEDLMSMPDVLTDNGAKLKAELMTLYQEMIEETTTTETQTD